MSIYEFLVQVKSLLNHKYDYLEDKAKKNEYVHRDYLEIFSKCFELFHNANASKRELDFFMTDTINELSK